MQEIMHSFSREKAQNAEHVQYMKFLLEEIPQEKAMQFGFILQWDAFSLSVNNEVSGFHPNKAFIETEVIRMYDNKRDKIYLMYKQIIQAIANYHPDEEKKQAGRTLSFVFKQAGRNVHRLSYDSETAILDKVVEKLRKEPYLSALALLEMNQIPDQIEMANQEFQTIYRQRMRTEREKILAVDMRKLRSQTDDAFNELAKAINALFEHFYSLAFHGIVGIVIAATVMIIPFSSFTASVSGCIINIICLVAGVITALLLDKFNSRVEVK